MNTFRSNISDKEFPISERVFANTLRQSLLNYIQKGNPWFTQEHCLAFSELNTIREKYISDYLTKQIGDLTEVEKTVLQSINNKETLSDKIDEDDDQALNFGQKIADKVASFGGSWT